MRYFIIISLLLSGCGTKLPPGMPKLYPAKLLITQDNAPLAKATVTVISSDAARPFNAGGQTDENGALQLRTEGQYPGIPAGEYAVTVSKAEGPDLALPTVANTDEEIAAYDKVVAEIVKNTFIVVDPKFSDIKTTPLKLEIKKGQNSITLDVSPKVKLKPPKAPPSKA
ncbi:MAG: carboxypeptidase-like regulatory domain-containing protein [Planctomycetaceae bacterium]|jgi:hypothetical protein|nr:carboxypeptidase-like regulatory domain-containing protein [Planctomycetaceae bacterium]